MVLQKLKSFFESKLSVAILFALFFVFNIFDLFYVSLIIATIYVATIFFICDDVKNIFAPILVVYYLINSMKNSEHYVWYYTCAGVGVLTFLIFIVKKCFVQKQKVKLGKMFWPLVCFGVAMMLGGIIGHFSAFNIIYCLAVAVLMFICYFIGLNFCKNLREHLLYILVCAALLISGLYLVNCAKLGDILTVLASRTNYMVGAQNINAASLYIYLGLCGCFFLGEKYKKFDYLFFALSVLILCLQMTTFCRGNILISLITFVGFSIWSIIKSNNKRYYLLVGLIYVVVLDIVFTFGGDSVNSIFETLLGKIRTGVNGREVLWKWCLNSFKENIWFGVGIMGGNAVPTIGGDFPNMVLAHNTFLQWLTSAGIIGSLIVVGFYFGKYNLLIKGIGKNKERWLLLLIIIGVALTGMVDSTACMDFTISIVVLLFLSTVEYETLVQNIEKKAENSELLNKIETE